MLFNIIILVFLCLVFILSFFVLGTQFAFTFFRSGWPLALVLILILGGLDIFYFLTRRLFLLLEREDWPALVQYLEGRVIRDGQYSARLVRLLANTYLVLADSAGVISLENKAAIAKPSLLDDNALIFGTARILGKDIPGAVRFFQAHKSSGKGEAAQWVCWYYGFSLLLDRQFDPAADQFLALANESSDAVLTGLSAFFLDDMLVHLLPDRSAQCAAAAEAGKKRVHKSFPRISGWNKEIARVRTEVYAAILSKYIGDASAWLYPKGI
jgi:hypothetical protein